MIEFDTDYPFDDSICPSCGRKFGTALGETSRAAFASFLCQECYDREVERQAYEQEPEPEEGIDYNAEARRASEFYRQPTDLRLYPQ